jgi:deoxyinosine 3'endonuclease (endonuclease V)
VNKFGMACHIGYFSDTPTIGISKKLYQVFGLENNQQHKDKIKSELKKAGDFFELRANEPQCSQNNDSSLLGYCYRSTESSSNPIYVSIGHKIGWQTCLWILKLVITKYRIPEPIRQADQITREFLRNAKF